MRTMLRDRFFIFFFYFFHFTAHLGRVGRKYTFSQAPPFPLSHVQNFISLNFCLLYVVDELSSFLFPLSFSCLWCFLSSSRGRKTSFHSLVTTFLQVDEWSYFSHLRTTPLGVGFELLSPLTSFSPLAFGLLKGL